MPGAVPVASKPKTMKTAAAAAGDMGEARRSGEEISEDRITAKAAPRPVVGNNLGQIVRRGGAHEDARRRLDRCPRWRLAVPARQRKGVDKSERQVDRSTELGSVEPRHPTARLRKRQAARQQ